jgi:riboflavin kinase/FMN adenylyltransferase
LKTCENLDNVPPPPAPGRVATIGVFDGVHAGHAAIFAETIRQARETGGESLVLTFTTHPRQALFGAAPPTICSVEERLTRIAALGIDVTVAVPFDDRIRSTPASEFLSEILGRRLGVKALVLGHDARFGKGREGDAAFARNLGWPVKVVGPVAARGLRVSSGAVRSAITEGRLDDAATLLGRRPTLRGVVVKGDGRGRELGFPTANLAIGLDRALPAFGIYVTRAHVREGTHESATNIGVRPTFDVEPVPTVETYILDFDDDIYGEEMTIELLERLRGEEKFASAEALIDQMHRDVAAARAYFQSEAVA